jgi:hypothetical protein
MIIILRKILKIPKKCRLVPSKFHEILRNSADFDKFSHREFDGFFIQIFSQVWSKFKINGFQEKRY